MKNQIIIMNFSHIYEWEITEKIPKDINWIDCTQIAGTNCFCDEEAQKSITDKMSDCAPEGIHLIDSGNYHYVSKFWTDKINYPFSLLVFDHHTDMQSSAFGQMISCGNWIQQALETNPNLQKVCIVGPNDKLINQINKAKYGSKLIFYSDDPLKSRENWNSFAQLHFKEPVYISIDKDVLNTHDAATNWDQGSMSLQTLKQLLSHILEHEEIIGVDICGEYSNQINAMSTQFNHLNFKTNKDLVEDIKQKVNVFY